MRYAFLNNFSQLLAADLAAGATTLTLDGGGSLLANASADLVYTLTLDDGEGTTEIVHVTGASGNDLTIERGKEGTTDRAWPTGTQVEMRLTAEILTAIQPHHGTDSILIGGAPTTAWESVTIGNGAQIHDDQGAGEYGDYSVVVGAQASINKSDECLALGYYSIIGPGRHYAAIALGSYAEVRSVDPGVGNAQGMAVGAYSLSENPAGGYGFACALGTGSRATGSQSLATGPYAVAEAEQSAAFGSNAIAEAERSAAFGSHARSYDTATNSTAIGNQANTKGVRAIAIGDRAEAEAPESVAIGAFSKVPAVAGGCRINAMPYLPSAASHPSGAASPAATRQCSSQVVIETDALDLTSGAAAVTLDLPAGTMLFIDSIDVVITGSDTPGGSPEISVGPDDVTPAAYLAATPVTKTAVGGRDTFTPLIDDGVTAIRAEVTTAGTGTTYQAKVVFRGYVMEV